MLAFYNFDNLKDRYNAYVREYESKEWDGDAKHYSERVRVTNALYNEIKLQLDNCMLLVEIGQVEEGDEHVVILEMLINRLRSTMKAFYY